MYSLLMCVYGGDDASFFKEAYESVLKQTLLPVQIVLVVDGPVPKELKNSVNNFKSRAIDMDISFDNIWFTKNSGHGAARREGVKKCCHDIIGLADADDINEPNRFEMQVKYLLAHEDVSIVGSQILEIDSNTKKAIGERRVPLQHSEVTKYLQTRCPFNQMSVVFKKADVLKSGNYIDFFHNEDYYLWIRMHLSGCIFANLSDVLVKARVDKDFYNRRGGLKYFSSEIKIQNLMYKENLISPFKWLLNVIPRFVIQVLLISSIRGVLFKLLFRNNKEIKHAE